MGIAEVIGEKRGRILNLAQKYGTENVRIFGSVATGSADSQSDIDFLVDMQSGKNLFDLGGLLMELQQLLGRKVDVITEKALRERIRRDVLKQAVPL